MPKISFNKSWIIFFAAAAIFLAIKVFAADYAVSDENTYYKMGQLVAEGQMPYRDFFFAHPPLQIYIYAAVFKVFGFNFFMLKMFSAVAAVAAAVFVFLAAKEKVNREAAVAAAVLFLFSYGTLLFTNFATGTELATAFSAAAFYLFIRKSFAATGVMLALAAVTTQLSAVAAIILFAAVVVMRDKKALTRMLLGFLPIFVVVNGIFLAAAKWEYVKQVVLYHLQKPSGAVDKSAVFFRVVKTNVPLLIAAALAFLSAEKKKLIIIASAAIAVAYIIGFPLAKASFNYYLYYAFPFLAILAAYGVSCAHGLLVDKFRLRKEFAAAALAAALVIVSFLGAKQFVSYDFQDFPQVEEIADYVRGNSTAGGTIFGDDSTVPLVSLLSGREIAINYVDNNDLRYRSGMTDLAKTLQLLEKNDSNLKFIIMRKINIVGKGTLDFGIGTLQPFSDFVTKNCVLAKEFAAEGKSLPAFYKIYDCLKT
ncbi:glycosyltransferase family 39 protein [Candidatus Micrarchaeota archaeon]|nr:glycosyltransferase family 39 protein [Candidatus Micrarchaeota archaeon]